MRRVSLVAGLVLAATMIGTLLLGSCSTPSTPSTSQTSTASSKPYGSLVVAVNFRQGGLDPQNNTPNTLQTAALAVFDSLVELTPDGKDRPGIAERWEISKDGLTHTFYIRKGVKFHDGSDLTGADVKFSLERIIAPESAHQDATSWRPQVAGIDLKDDFTVAVRLKQPLFELMKGLADFAGSSAIVPKKYIEEKGVDNFRRNPIGSGPWKVVKWEAGNRLDLEAMESHWRAVPKFKNITLLNVAEEGTKVAMLKTGELDVAEVASDSLPALKAAGLRIFGHDGGAQYFTMVFFDVDNPQNDPFGNVKVRKALSLAVDRKELSEKLYGGYATPSAVFFVRPTAYFWDSNQLKVDPFDPEGAKKLLAEAGYPSGTNTKIWEMGGGGLLTTFNMALAGYLRRIGVNTEMSPIDQAALSQLTRPKLAPQTFTTLRPQLTGGGVFQFEKMVQVYHSTKASTRNIKNLKLDELIDKVPMTLDPAEKKRISLEATVMAKNEYTDIPFIDMQTLLAMSAKIGEFTPIKGMTGLAASFETLAHSK